MERDLKCHVRLNGMKTVNVASCKEDANESKIINEKYHNHASTLNRYASHIESIP